MKKFIVVDSFFDTEDEDVHYPVNSIYPREGYLPSEERIATLESARNNKGTILIKPLIELPAKEVKQVDNEEQETVTFDRDAIKAELDALGVTYAKNAKTEILAELLAAQKQGE
ncbi:hypothetical protein [Streptococcus ovis]|uniref:hypothetical protein n=1 Tax=Streptococcus ovis TaxID=82806 RepID=UPI00035D1743|nr:hypothetical protein [Streptococcus ovis]